MRSFLRVIVLLGSLGAACAPGLASASPREIRALVRREQVATQREQELRRRQRALEARAQPVPPSARAG